MPRYLIALLGSLSAMVLTACHVNQPALAPAPPPEPFTNPAGIPEDNFAFLTPARVSLYLQFDNVATWRGSPANEALAAQVFKAMKEVLDPQAWSIAAGTLGLSTEQLRDQCFGQSLAFVGVDGGEGLAYAVWSRADPARLLALPGAMQLKPISNSKGSDAMTLYVSADDSLLLAIREDRLLVAPGRHRAWFEQLAAFASTQLQSPSDDAVTLRAVSTSSAFIAMTEAMPQAKVVASRHDKVLARDERYQDLLQKLPSERSVLLFTQDPKQDGRHAVVVAMKGEHLSAHYAARIKKFDEFYRQFERAGGASFGPAPSDAIAAASVNLIKKDNKGMGMLNFFVFPRNMEDHVLPKLAAPMVVFLTSMPGSELKKDVTVRVPVGVVAIRLKNRDVADDLDRIVGGFHLLANLGELNVIEGVFGGQRETEGDVAFRVADFGQAIVKRIKDPATVKMFKLPELQLLTRISYGRIGDWYVLCTQEKAFRQLVKQHGKSEATLDGSGAARAFQLDAGGEVIFNGVVRAPQLAGLSDELTEYWKKLEVKAELPAPTQEEAAARKKREETAAARQIRKPMEWIADAIKHRHSFSVQVWRDEAGDLRGVMKTVEGER